MNADALFFSALLSGTHSVSDLRALSRDHLTDDWQPVYDFVLSFAQHHGKLPRKETVEGQFGMGLPPAPENVGYYAKAVEENALRVAMEDGFTEKVAEPLDRADPRAALAGAREVLSEVTRTFRPKDRGLILPDLSHGVPDRMADYQRRKHSRHQIRLPLPWNGLTEATQGFMPGDSWCLLARPSVGKTWGLIVVASYLCEIGYNVLFASMETPPQSMRPKRKNHRVIKGCCIHCHELGVSQSDRCPAADIPRQRLSMRFDAVGARVSAWRFANGLLTPMEEERLATFYDYISREESVYGRMRIVAAPHVNSVADLEMEILDFEPDITFWDSAYLAAHGRDKRNSAANLVLDYVEMNKRTGVPGLMSWHFNRDVEPGAMTASMNSAILTDEIGRAMDNLIGLFRPKELEQAGEAYWRTLKVRDGLPLRELKTYFRVKEDLNFGEISESEGGMDGQAKE